MVTSVCPFRLAVASWAESSVWPPVPDAVPAFEPEAARPAWLAPSGPIAAEQAWSAAAGPAWSAVAAGPASARVASLPLSELASAWLPESRVFPIAEEAPVLMFEAADSSV